MISLAKDAKKRFYIIIKKERRFLAKIAKKRFYIVTKKKEDISQRSQRKDFVCKKRKMISRKDAKAQRE